MQTHCQTNKKIKRADQILPEVYGTTLNKVVTVDIYMYIMFLLEIKTLNGIE